MKGGRHRAELYTLSAEARAELRHPFTLRTYLDLCANGASPPQVLTQSELMERWLNHRLDAEANRAERITRELFHEALKIVATGPATNAGAVSVDQLVNVPRFDPRHPPGPVVQALIEASILETVPEHADRIRFTVEAVQDFYRAEADVDGIRAEPTSVAQRFAALRFTDAHPRLAQIGRRLATDEVRHSFVTRLAEMDPRMAAVVLVATPSQYAPDLRASITRSLAQDIADRHRVRAAFAITMLGELDCPEAVDVLVQYLLPPATPHRYVKAIGARAFAKLGYTAAAEFVYRWGRLGVFQGNDTYYFREQLALLRHAKPQFRQVLAEQAGRYLDSPSGDPKHVRAVYVLANLGDECLVEHLGGRLSENGALRHYENHALIALGTDGAGSVFARSVLAVGEKLAKLSNDSANNNARNDLIWPVHLLSADVRYLITPALEPHLLSLIENSNPDVSRIASHLVKTGAVVSLFLDTAFVSARRHNGSDFPHHGERSIVTPELWLAWWRKVTDPSVQKTLLEIAPRCPSVELEEALLQCLDTTELRGQAAKLLGEYGAVRAAPRLRQILSQTAGADALWDQMAAAHALGDLRDNTAVPLLKAMISAYPKSTAAIFAAASLGVIGTPEAEKALSELLVDGVAEDHIVPALIACGSASATGIVVARAKTRPDGPGWLCSQAGRLSWTRGWTRGRYHTHINMADVVAYLDATDCPRSPEKNWALVRAFEKIDSPDIRYLLRKWAKRRGTPADAVVRKKDTLRMSYLCVRELTDRGDESAIPYVLDAWADRNDKTYVQLVADDLRHFPSRAVAEEVRERLAAAVDNSQVTRMLSLLGRFGDASDGERVRPFLDHLDDLVANVACESLLRLTDPLLVPEEWREV